MEKNNPSRHLRAQINPLQKALKQKQNRMIWDSREEQNREPEEGTLRREELHRVVEKIRNLPQKQQGDQPETSGGTK